MTKNVTGNTQAILEIVRAAGNHPTAQEIYEAVRQKRPHIGLASVYRILRSLVKQGVIKEIGASEESHRYDGRLARHDHAVCTQCGALIDLPDEILLSQEHLRQAARTAGIELESHEVRLYGRCANCRK
jgi:Fur family transcriptional regulator, peroxide stress response regulator